MRVIGKALSEGPWGNAACGVTKPEVAQAMSSVLPMLYVPGATSIVSSAAAASMAKARSFAAVSQLVYGEVGVLPAVPAGTT